MSVQVKWGLVIQGPRTSSGLKGPNASVPDSPNVMSGFDATDTVVKNLSNAQSLVTVISTWIDSGFREIEELRGIRLLESRVPLQDWDNRRKQFVSTHNGITELEKQGVSHVIKIRTDQEISSELFEWVRETCERTNKIVVSDLLDSEAFYVGDFIWAGEISKLKALTGSVLNFGGVILDPSISKDWVLKFAIATENRVWSVLNKDASLGVQIRDKRNLRLQEFWRNFRSEHFIPIPRTFLASIVWRGRRMSSVIPVEHFSSGQPEQWEVVNSRRLTAWAPRLELLRDKRRYAKTLPKSRKRNSLSVVEGETWDCDDEH